MKVKLCGTRRIEDIGYMNEFSPDYAGFILSEGFRRTVNYSTLLFWIYYNKHFVSWAFRRFRT